jgi:hypothetical protein
VAFESFDNAFLASHCSGQQGGKTDDVRVEFLGFQHKIAEGDVDAESKICKPLAESMEPTRVLPISWMSPFIVPRTTLPSVSRVAPIWWIAGSRTAAFIASPARTTSGRNISPGSNCSPTARNPETKGH